MKTAFIAACLLAGSGVEIPGLLANGPLPGRESEMALFGQFIGDWELEVTFHLPNGETERWPGTWSFRWALEGRAIQDLWRAPSAAASAKSGKSPRGLGTTLRVFDQASGAWNVTWVGVMGDGRATTFRAALQGDEIVMESKNEEGPFKWIFSEITSNSFQWRAVSSSDGGKSWLVQQEMKVWRVGSRR